MKTNLKKYYTTKILLLLLPVILFIIVRFILGFNGLYGQDSHEYYRYSRAILNYLKTGVSPGDYFWPVYYPILGAISGLILADQFSLQLISILSLSGSLFFLLKILDKIYDEKNRIVTYLLITFFLSPYVFRNSLVVMGDLLTVFLVTASFYFFIMYLNKFDSKNVILFSIFSVVAVLTRYAAFVILIIPAIIIFYNIIRKRNFSHLAVAVIIGIVLTIPHILIRKLNSTDFLEHVWLQRWSVLNYFKSNFTTPDGIEHFRLPNILYSFSNIFYPTFLFFGVILVLFLRKNHFGNKFWLIALLIIILNALFLAGIPYQNQRFLLLSYPLVVILLFPGYEQFIRILINKRIFLYPVTFLMIIIQIIFCIYFFRSAYQRNVLEKEVATFVKNDNHKNIYAFDIDVSFMSYNVMKNVINMRNVKIDCFDHHSLVIFNEDKFKVQWANMNPMLNWNNLKSNYTLSELKNFGNGWKAYEIR